MLEVDMTSWLIKPNLFNCLSSPSKGWSEVLQVTWPLTNQIMNRSVTRIPYSRHTDLYSYLTGGPVGGVLALCRGAVIAFYSSIWHGTPERNEKREIDKWKEIRKTGKGNKEKNGECWWKRSLMENERGQCKKKNIISQRDKRQSGSCLILHVNPCWVIFASNDVSNNFSSYK